MKKRLLAVFAGILCVMTCVITSFDLWATPHVSEEYVENVYALDNDYFFFTCASIDGDICIFTCLKCGQSFGNENGTFGRAVGKCPICQHLYPDTVKYDNIGGLRW